LANQNSGRSRRSFVRRLLGLVAAGGAASLLLGGEAKQVTALSGTGSSGQVAYWTDSGTLGSYPSILDGNGNIAFGAGNTANGAAFGKATVAGGVSGSATAGAATVGGGQSNLASGPNATVAGGYSGSATKYASTVGGGEDNSATNDHATIGGGFNNSAAGAYSTIGGGNTNATSGVSSTVGGGEFNQAIGNWSTVPGGYQNRAYDDYSFAAGTQAVVSGGFIGAFVWADDQQDLGGVDFAAVAANEFAVRATGGFRFVTAIDVLSGNATKQLTISSGFLGISTSGASTPQYPFDLRTPGSSSAQMHISPANADSGGYLTSANAGNLFMSAGAAWNGSAWVAKNSSAYQYGGGPAGVRFFFDTGLTVGGTYAPTTRMFIGPTGHVGIGMSTAPAHLLQLGLDDAAKPSTNTWTIASDGRLKDPESIEPFTEGLDFIESLPQPVWFRYRKESGFPNDKRVVGWIAQDVAAVAPFMIRRTRQKLDENDSEEAETLSLNTNELPYALVNSVKELRSQIAELKKMVQRQPQDGK
jgi:hypothetical protein